MRRLKFPAWIVIAVALCCTASVFASVFSYQRPPAELELSNRVAADSLSGRRGSLRLYRIAVPVNASDLQFTVYGSAPAQAVDLYARFNARPTPQSFDARSTGPGADKTIAIQTPEAGTYYLLLHAARGAYSDLSLVASYAPAGSVFKIGMHAHRLYNGGDWDGPASPKPLFRYGIIRDWDISHLHDAAVWKPDGSIDFKLIDRVYEGHARNGAKVIKTFGSVPTWASKRPAEPNPQYPNWPGAKSGPRDLDRYEDYVFRFVSHVKNSLWAVEGWNEPYACPGDAPTEFTTMTPTELADVQKRVYLATKRVDPRILVFSPAQAYVCGIPTILGARTSQNEPMSKFFDVLAWHPYNRSAKGNAGPSYAEEVGKVRQHLAHAGLSQMPIADTEHGWLDAPKEGGKEFHALGDEQKGQVLFDTARLAKSLGVLAVVWYGYDNKMLGTPMNNPKLSRRLQQIYDDFDTK